MSKDNDFLHNQLIKLGEMMGDGLHYEDPWIEKEYNNICKMLYPDMFPKRKRRLNNKPSKALIRTMNDCPCGNKQFSWQRKDGLVRFSCPKCERTTEYYETNSKARDDWNKGIEDG